MAPLDLAPQESTVVALPVETPALAPGAAYHLRVSFHLRADTPWAPAGHEIGWRQLEMPYDVPPAALADSAPAPELECLESGNRIAIKGQGFELVFSKTTGTIASLRYGDRRVIRETSNAVCGPVLNVFRAPVNNDKYCAGGWHEAGLADLRREVKTVSSELADPRTVVIETRVTSHGESGCRFDLSTTWTVLADGCINVDSSIVPHNAPSVLPRIGLRMELPAEYDNLTWLGRGPHENYVDRKRGADVGRYSSTVAEQFVPYVHPQETGAKQDVRWVALTDDSGAGLLLVAASTMSVTALHHTSQELAHARHPVELPKSDRVFLCVDTAQHGLGGASCGPAPMAKYVLRPRPLDFAFSLRPYSSEMGELSEVARRVLPVLPRVGIRRDEAGIASLSCPHPYANIRYTIDGNDPVAEGRLYDGPFELASGGTVRAVAVGSGLLASLVSSETFSFLVPRDRWSVLYCDSEHPGEGEAQNAIDGDPSTYWHTKWGGDEPRHPHELQIDLGDVYELAGITYLPRQGNRNGRVGEFELFAGTDARDWGPPVGTGRFANTTELQKVMFHEPVRARFIQLIAKSEVAGNAWTSVAELDVIATGPRSRGYRRHARPGD